jgi:hypothetical protein
MALVVVAVLTLVVAMTTPHRAGRAGQAGTAPAAGVPHQQPPAQPGTVTTPTPVIADGVRPVRVDIAAIGVRSRLESLDLNPDSSLQPPHDPARAGWYAGGPVPGDVGPAVIAGHVDSTHGPAVFWRLRRLHPGDRITVERSDGSSTQFAVTEVRLVPLGRFPTGEVYGATPDRALRLITCGGSYDHAKGHYRENVVVFALAV